MDSIPEFIKIVAANAIGTLIATTIHGLITWLSGKLRSRGMSRTDSKKLE